MRKIWCWCVLAGLSLTITGRALGQAPAEREGKGPDGKAAEKCDPATTKEEVSVTDHSIRIGGQTIPYKATASTTLLKNEKDEPVALLYSTAYTRSDIKDVNQRPLAFLYNGGPGASSIWVHMGAYGPRRVASVD